MTQTPIQRPARSSASRRPTSVTIPILNAVDASFIVMCREDIGDPWPQIATFLSGVVPHDLHDLLAPLVLGGRVEASVARPSDLPAEMWECITCPHCSHSDAELIQRAESARAHVYVQSPGCAGDGPAHIWAGLATARAIALARDGVIFDPTSPRLLPWSPADHPWDDPLSQHGRHSTSSWVWCTYSLSSDGTVWMTTSGLNRFGLPDLSLHDLDVSAVDVGRRVLTGVAHSLLSRVLVGPERPAPPTQLRVATEQLITAEIQRRAYPAHHASDPYVDTAVRLRRRRHGPDPSDIDLEITLI